MTPSLIIKTLLTSGATLVFEGCLKYRGPKSALTDELRQEIAVNKRLLILYLGFCPSCGQALQIIRETDRYLLSKCPTEGCSVCHLQNKLPGERGYWTENLSVEDLARLDPEVA